MTLPSDFSVVCKYVVNTLLSAPSISSKSWYSRPISNGKLLPSFAYPLRYSSRDHFTTDYGLYSAEVNVIERGNCHCNMLTVYLFIFIA